jgi:hypothetical protein
MARDHDSLKRRQVAVDIGPERIKLGLQTGQLTVDVDLPLSPDPLQIIDLPLQLQQRLLEIEATYPTLT